MGSATRSILAGLQIGNSLGAPIAQALQAAAQRDFEKQMQEEKLKQEIALMAAKDPNLAQSLTSMNSVVDGQQAVRAMPVDQNTLQDQAFRIGDNYLDPKKLKDLEIQDELRKTENQIAIYNALGKGNVYDPKTGFLINKGTGTAYSPEVGGGTQPTTQPPSTTPTTQTTNTIHQTLTDKAAKDFENKQSIENIRQQGANSRNDSNNETKKTLADVVSGQKGQKQFDDLLKQANPITASSRSALGIVAASDNRANRALKTLQKKDLTNQEAANIMTDIAGIYKAGSPTESEEANNNYSTLFGKIQGAMQYLSGNPTSAVPDAIKQKLLETVNDMKETNRAVIQQQHDILEATHPDLIRAHQDEWNTFRQKMAGGLASGINSPVATTPIKINSIRLKQ